MELPKRCLRVGVKRRFGWVGGVTVPMAWHNNLKHPLSQPPGQTTLSSSWL